MKRNKMVAAWLAVMLFATVVLSACGSSGETSATPGSTVNPTSGANTSAATERIAIEYMMIGWGNQMPRTEDDYVKQALDEALHIDFTLNLPTTSDEMTQQLNLRAAGNDLPDVIKFSNKNLYEQYVANGLLLDLTPYLNQLTDVQALNGENAFTLGEINGIPYSITLNPAVYFSVPWIRKDWLDNLNLPVPTTLDELIEVSIAFTEDDPDGNGRPDTFGITSSLTGLVSVITAQHATVDSFYLQDGEMVHGLYQPEMKEAVQYIADVLATNSVDPEIASNQIPNAKDNAFQGRAGILITGWPDVVKDEEIQKWKDANPEAEWIMISELEGPNGNYLSAQNITANSGYVAIAKSVENDKAKLDKILELLNYTAKGDGLNLVQFGLEGTHFTLENDAVVLTDRAGEAGYTWVYQLVGRPEKEYLSAKFPRQIPYIEANDAIETLPIYTDLTLPDGYNAADADRFKSEELLKFYFDKQDISTFDDFLHQLDTTFRHQIFLDSAMEQFRARGYVE